MKNQFYVERDTTQDDDTNFYSSFGEDSNYAELYIAIMESALHDEDVEYFTDGSFDYHCNLLGKDKSDVIKLLVERAKNKRVTLDNQ